jgi:hypothetical protein
LAALTVAASATSLPNIVQGTATVTLARTITLRLAIAWVGRAAIALGATGRLATNLICASASDVLSSGFGTTSE